MMTLFIADTNDRVRERLASIAASVEGIAVVGEAGDVGSAIGGIKRAKPDSVIVALPLSGGSGLDVLSSAQSVNPASAALMLTQSPCNECENKCFALGADYFFEKSSELKKIVTTIVLLAHQSNQTRNRTEQETVRRSIRSFLRVEEPSKSFQLDVAAVCPRLAISPGAKSNVCFLAGIPSQISSRSIVR
jgi:DNA-binding NarL/FixJ family response regulator